MPTERSLRAITTATILYGSTLAPSLWSWPNAEAASWRSCFSKTIPTPRRLASPQTAPGSASVDHIDTGVGGGDGPAAAAPPRQFTQDTITQFGGHNLASLVDGAVGADVAAVTIHASGRLVEATTRDGRFAAWWPGEAFADGPSQPSGKGGPQLNLRYDVTLTEGPGTARPCPAEHRQQPTRLGPSIARPRETPISQRSLRPGIPWSLAVYSAPRD